MKTISKVLHYIWLLFPAVLFIILVWVLFSFLPQGQDILVIAVENSTSATLFILVVSFFAFMCWYSSRIIVYINSYLNEENEKEKDEKQRQRDISNLFPRLLGYFSFFGAEAAIINNPYFDSQHDTLWASLLFLAQVLICVVIYFIFKKYTQYKRFSIWLIAITLLIVFVCTFTLSEKAALQSNFTLLLINLWVVQTAFFMWTFIRSQKVNRDSGVVRWEMIKIFGRKVALLPATEIPFFRSFNYAMIVPTLIYLASIFSIPSSRVVAPFNIVLLGFSILVGFLHVITMINLWRKINFHFLLFMLAIIVGLFFSPYDLRKTEVEQKAYNNRPSITKYTADWLNARKDEIEKSDTFKVYFVLADGGASRSGYWVAGALGRLETETGHEFSNRLFCLSGASGGSVGNAVYYSLLDTATYDANIRKGDFSLMARNYLKSDFLSYTISHLLGPDYFRHMLPLELTVDRGAALEKSMENPDYNDTVGRLFAKQYSDYLKNFNATQLPVFYINTTRVADGKPGVISNVLLNNKFSSRIDVLAMMDTIGDNGKPFGDIHLSTAAVLSARFPYLSPAANIKDWYFVDGGYFDNSGAGIVMETIAAMLDTTQFADSTIQLLKKLQFNIIHLSNSERTPLEPKRMHPLVNDLATPLLTLAGSYSQQTNVNNDRLRTFISTYANTNCNDCWTTINLYDRDTATDKDTNSFSMNWVISATTLDRMDKRLLYNKNLNKLIHQLKK